MSPSAHTTRRPLPPLTRWCLRRLGPALLSVAAWLMLLPPLRAQIVTETFRTSTAPDWTLGNQSGSFTPTLTGGSIDTSGEGWLRLTSTGTNQATYAVYNNSFLAENASVYAQFTYTSWGGTGADGLTFFLFDGSSTFQAGAYGGSLGYAQRTSPSTVNGMNGGYLGIGIDEYGNFSNATEGRLGGSGFTPDSISVRGPGQGTTGYAYLGGTGTLAAGIDFPGVSTRPDQAGADYRQVAISISPTNQLSVFLQSGASGTPQQILALDLSGYARPETLRFGFTASSGDSTNIHEIRDLNISTVQANLWDRGGGSNAWGTAANWNPNYLPTNNGDVLFDNTFVNTAQTVDLGGTTRTLRSVSVDAPFAYNLTNGTLALDKGSAPGASGIFVSGTKGNADHTFATNITIANAATISNDSTGNLTVSGNVATGGHALTVGGSGASTYTGTISGTGSLAKSGTGTVTLQSANTYSGGTTLAAGTLAVGNAQALGSGSVALQGGTLAGTANQTIANNLTLQGNAGLSNITSSGTLTQSGGNRTLSLNNATQSGAVSLSDTGTNRTLTVQVDSGSSSLSGIISNGSSTESGLTKTGLGTLVLGGANTYTGVTTVSSGTLQLAASDRISNSSNLNLAGGTLNLNGASEQVGNLTFSNGGAIDFGSTAGENYLLFQNTYGTPSGVLSISNYQSGTDILASQATLTAGVLDSIYFVGIGSGASQGTAQTVTGYGSGWLPINPTGSSALWYTWDSGNSTNRWDRGANWRNTDANENIMPPSYAKVAFGTGSQTTVDIRANRIINALRFNGAGDYGGNAASFTISGSGDTLTMAGTSVSSSAIAFIQQKSTNNQSITVSNLNLQNNTVVDMIGTGNLTISSALQGSANLVKEGTGGTLILSGNSSSYTGGIFLNAGTTQISNANALGSSATGSTTIASGATLAVTNNITSAEQIAFEGSGVGGNGAIRSTSGSNTLSGALTLTSNARLQADTSATLNLTGNLSSSGTNALTFGGAGAINYNGVLGHGAGSVVVAGSGTTTFGGSGSNTFTGSTSVQDGTLVLNKSGGATAIAGNLVIGDGSGAANSATVQLNASNQIADAASITFNADGRLNLNNQSETVAKITGTSSASSIALGSGTLTVSSSQSSQFAGAISGTGALVKAGSGDMTLSGPSTYSGGTTVQSGILAASNGSAFGTGTVAVQSSGNIELSNNITVANAFNIAGQGTYANDGAIQSTAGSNTLSGAVTVSSDARVRADTGSTLTFTNSIALGANTLTVSGGGTTNVNGSIGGTGGLTKIDAGLLVINGASSYSGATTINGGTLKLGASNVLSNSTNVAVNSGTFDVNGMTNTIGSLNVASGAAVALGTGTLYTTGGTISGLITGNGLLTPSGTLTITSPQSFNGALVLNSGSTLNLAATASGSSFGTLVLNGGTLNLGTGGLSGTPYSYNFTNIQVNQPSTIDFGNGISVTLNAGTLNIGGSGGLTINNWVEFSDYFLAQNWTGGVYNVRGTTPYNQVGFNGYSPNNTAWLPYSPGIGQITPVPEPSTYGAIFMGLCTAVVFLRRKFFPAKKQGIKAA